MDEEQSLQAEGEQQWRLLNRHRFIARVEEAQWNNYKPRTLTSAVRGAAYFHIICFKPVHLTLLVSKAGC
uniref:Uncharacterized protein n=1 Tax=Knipowitschia caucasica TaxID=637954 RepID=A0AAV2K5M5_KNICA